MNNLKIKKSKHSKLIINQFGELKIDLSKIITFSKGIIGIPNASKFVLIQCPIEKFKDFMLLQSVEYDELAFMLYPLLLDPNNCYEENELEDACKLLNIPIKDAAIMLVVSTKMIEDRKKLVVNTRAPIFIDSVNLSASQYVLANTKLEIQKVL